MENFGINNFFFLIFLLDSNTDEFEALRIQREKERQERRRQKLTAHLGINFDIQANLTAPNAYSTPYPNYDMDHTSNSNLDNSAPYDPLRFNNPPVPDRNDIVDIVPPLIKPEAFLLENINSQSSGEHLTQHLESENAKEEEVKEKDQDENVQQQRKQQIEFVEPKAMEESQSKDA